MWGGGVRFVICNLSEPLPDRTRVVNLELVLEFLRVQLFNFSDHLAKAVTLNGVSQDLKVAGRGVGREVAHCGAGGPRL